MIFYLIRENFEKHVLEISTIDMYVEKIFLILVNVSIVCYICLPLNNLTIFIFLFPILRMFRILRKKELLQNINNIIEECFEVDESLVSENEDE